MLRVLIADDEVRVCQLIEMLADWDELGMTVVGMAHDGIEALRLIKEKGPDIVITDIRMPGYDGLELIARAKELRSELIFVIISGYAHFEYAQTALKYGVSDYLLKPIQQAELMKTLRKLAELLKHRDESQSRDKAQRQQSQNDAKRLRTALVLQLYEGEEIGNELSVINASYHFRFEKGRFRAFVLKLVSNEQPAGEQMLAVVWARVAQQFRDKLANVCGDMELCACDGLLVGMCGYAIDKSADVRRALKDALSVLCAQTDFFVGMSFSLALGTEGEAPAALSDSFRYAKDVLCERFLEGMGTMLERRPEGSGTDFAALLLPFTADARAAWEVLNPEAGERAVMELMARLPANTRLCGRELVQLIQRAKDVTISLKPMELSDEALLEAYDAACNNAQNAEMLIKALMTFFCGELVLAAEDKRQETTRPIRLAKQIIREQYASTVTLEQIAAQCGFNASYFSTLFKKECGMGFLEYLCSVRMEMAKSLLRDTGFLVSEICERVGYSDIKHFTKTFKKYTDLKPGEYRKLYS